MNSSFFIFICLFFIEGSLEVLYRVFQNKSKRHCTEAATSVPVTSNRNPSAFPALWEPKETVAETKLTSARRPRRTWVTGGARNVCCGLGKGKMIRPKSTQAMESEWFTLIHRAAFKPLIITNTKKEVNIWRSEDNKCLSMYQKISNILLHEQKLKSCVIILILVFFTYH